MTRSMTRIAELEKENEKLKKENERLQKQTGDLWELASFNGYQDELDDDEEDEQDE